MIDRHLDAALVDLAGAIEFPSTPDLRGSVAQRLAERPAARRWFGSFPRAVALAIVALLLLATAAVALVLALPGLRLTFVPTLPAASAAADPLGARMALGAPMPIEEAADLAPGALRPPDEAYVIGDDEIVSLVYAASPELPGLDGTGIGLLVQAIEGALDRDQIHKLVVEVGAVVTSVTVDGEPGFWITGPPHLLRYLGPNGDARAEATRLVGDTLVWERDGTLYRLESGLGLEETLRIAETIEP